MDLKSCVALVTGANRGVGKALVDALMEAGVRRIYAGSRASASITDDRLVPILLDVTNPKQMQHAVVWCPDVTLLINNAGIMEPGALLDANAQESLRRQLETNALSPLRMAQAFAPTIQGNGGGAIVNILSVVSWFTPPAVPAYAASKHAALAVTDGLRMELADKGIHVAGAYAGFIDTDMTAEISQPKVSARSVADAVLEGIRNRSDHIFCDDRSQQVWQAMRGNPFGFMASVTAQRAAKK